MILIVLLGTKEQNTTNAHTYSYIYICLPHRENMLMTMIITDLFANYNERLYDMSMNETTCK